MDELNRGSEDVVGSVDRYGLEEERSDLHWLSKLSVELFNDQCCLGPASGSTGGELAHDSTDVAHRIVCFPSFHSIQLHCLWL